MTRHEHWNNFPGKGETSGVRADCRRFIDYIRTRSGSEPRGHPCRRALSGPDGRGDRQYRGNSLFRTFPGGFL